MPMVSRSHVTQKTTAMLTYNKYVREDVPDLIHSENAKEYLAATTIAVAREFGTHTTKIAPHNPDKNGLPKGSIVQS